jgi:hypothetical protein
MSPPDLDRLPAGIIETSSGFLIMPIGMCATALRLLARSDLGRAGYSPTFR